MIARLVEPLGMSAPPSSDTLPYARLRADARYMAR